MKVSNMEVLQSFLPPDTLDFVDNLIKDADDLEIKISKPRLSKWGSYVRENGRHEITVNSNLNPYQFLLTLLHEYAHYLVAKRYDGKVKPHGKEWKNTFTKILQDLIAQKTLPDDLTLLLEKHARNPRASITADLKLKKHLDSYSDSVIKNGYTTLELLEEGQDFIFHGRVFRKMEKRRKLYKCLDVERNKYYLFQPDVIVKKISG